MSSPSTPSRSGTNGTVSSIKQPSVLTRSLTFGWLGLPVDQIACKRFLRAAVSTGEVPYPSPFGDLGAREIPKQAVSRRRMLVLWYRLVDPRVYLVRSPFLKLIFTTRPLD